MPTNSQISNDPDLKTFPARDAAFTVRTRLKAGSVSVASRPFEAMPDGALLPRLPAGRSGLKLVFVALGICEQ